MKFDTVLENFFVAKPKFEIMSASASDVRPETAYMSLARTLETREQRHLVKMAHTIVLLLTFFPCTRSPI